MRSTREERAPAGSVAEFLRNRAFILYWLGQAVSQVGDEVYMIALVWQTIRMGSSPLVQGSVFATASVPRLMFILLGGVLSDRWNRLRIVLLSDLIRGVLVLLLAYWSWRGTLTVGHLHVFALLFGLADAFFMPAAAAMLPGLVPARHLARANSLVSFTQQANLVVGPALGGVLVATQGPSTGFALDALTFFLSAAALSLIPLLTPLPPQKNQPRSSASGSVLWAEIREGLAYVAKQSYLRAVVIAGAVVNLALVGPSAFALPNWVNQELQLAADAHGILRSAAGVGAVVAAGLMLLRPPERLRGVLVFLSVVGLGLVWGGFAWFHDLRVLVVFFALLGVFLTNMATIGSTVMQAVSGERILGRVMSLFQLSRYGAASLSYVVTGLLSQAIPLSWLFHGAGLMIVAAGVGGLLSRAREQD